MNHPFRGGKSLPARQEDRKLLGKKIGSYKFCFGRTCISITMQFINEVLNGGVPIILFVVTNIVCVPKKRKGICPFFGVSKARGNT